jgi:hypothetical protein
MNDGNNGTPNAGCAGGSCLQEYPNIAAFEDALIITTEQTGFVAFGISSVFYGANVYAVDMAALLRGAFQANTALVITATENDRSLRFLVPAQQAGKCTIRNTFLMATEATALQAQPSTAKPNSLKLLTLLGTATLSEATPDVELRWSNKEVSLDIAYSSPPPVAQKPGPIPLGNVTYGASEVQRLDAGLGQMASLVYVDDKLYASWGTALDPWIDQRTAGVAWAVIDPKHPSKSNADGILDLPGGNSLLIPALTLRPGGKGVLAISVAGPDYWPSVGYVVFDGYDFGPRANIKIVATGAGPTDDYLGYIDADEFNPFGVFATAVVTAEGRFWFANQYVAQTCTVPEYLVPGSPRFTCGNTRVRLANWATRITEVEMVKAVHRD